MAPIIPILQQNNIRAIGIGTDYGSELFFKSGFWKGEFFISPDYEIYKRIPELRRVALGGLAGLCNFLCLLCLVIYLFFFKSGFQKNC